MHYFACKLEKDNGDKEAYNKQWNYCMSLIEKTKSEHYNNLHRRKVAYNKSFWKYIKPLFFDKRTKFNEITVVAKD